MHRHFPGGTGELSPSVRRRVRWVLAAIVLPLFVATLAGLIALHPGQASRMGELPEIVPGKQVARVQVLDRPAGECTLPESTGDSLLQSAVCARVIDGAGQGANVPVHVPPEYKSTVGAGTIIKAIYDPDEADQGTPYLFWDIERSTPLIILGVLYVILVIAVAGRRGLYALVGLVASTAVLVGFIVPSLMSGSSPLGVTLVGSSAMLFVSVYMAHGVTIRTTTALLGTFVGLGITVSLAMFGVRAANLTGANGEDSLALFSYFPDLSLSALLTCGIVIAGLGALNDVTITQASAVWELAAANPTMSRWRLFSRAMRIGADHIASTVYTLAFAYAGTALPTLLLALMVDRSPGSLLVAGDIAEEVVRTLVASIGLILAIPMTSGVGTLLVSLVGAQENKRALFARWRRSRPLPEDTSMWEVGRDA